MHNEFTFDVLRLEDYIDSCYENGASQKELNKLETLYAGFVSEDDLNITEDDINVTEEGGGFFDYSLELHLFQMYHRFLYPDQRCGMELKDILSNLRCALEEHGQLMGGFKAGVTDEQILDAAKDVYFRRVSLISRYRNKATTSSAPQCLS